MQFVTALILVFARKPIFKLIFLEHTVLVKTDGHIEKLQYFQNGNMLGEKIKAKPPQNVPCISDWLSESPRPAASASLRDLLECKFSGSKPDLLAQKLRNWGPVICGLAKLPGQFLKL